ncbi:MAG: hypothetical protein GF411_12785 [Candidatus Lokiarchaeota archaeon]|nr:hypothetical protein [Candidatus Lokiarchaeota archaeon]
MMQVSPLPGSEFHVLSVIFSVLVTIIALQLYRKTRVKETLIFAVYPLCYGIWQVISLPAEFWQNIILAKIGYLIGIAGILALFAFGERIHTRSGIREIVISTTFGAFLLALATDTMVHISPVTGEVLFGFGIEVILIGTFLTNIIGIWMVRVSYKVYKRTKSLEDKKPAQAAMLFMLAMVILIFAHSGQQSASLFLAPGFEQRSLVLIPTLGPLFILLSLWRFSYIPYVLTIEAEALTVYHTSGIPIYHRTLSNVVTHDPALLTGALSAINSFTKEVVSDSQLNAIQLGSYILEHYHSGEYTILLVTLSKNSIVSSILQKFVESVAERLKKEDPAGPEVTKIVSEKFKNEVPILVELAPPT